MQLNDILRVAIKGQASDIHLKAGLPPLFRVDGALVPLKDGERLTPEMLHQCLSSITTPGTCPRWSSASPWSSADWSW